MKDRYLTRKLLRNFGYTLVPHSVARDVDRNVRIVFEEQHEPDYRSTV